jgi:predicted site-specific integrase-resolvase
MPEQPNKLTPRDYGKLRGVSPQLIYYHLREGNIQSDVCDCGRKVVNVNEADKYRSKKR